MPASSPELDLETTTRKAPVTCLGQTFPDDEARRAHFRSLLAEKLRDPAFRQQEGFPKATDEAILRLSDPPYYTACPNPFAADYVRHHGTSYDADEDSYRRVPFSGDVSEGKTDALYKAHGYHTKVPHKAIVRYVLHYTDPGDVVLDAFCGSGMTGVAAQLCADPGEVLKRQIADERKAAGLPAPRWGARRAVLGDLGPYPAFIAAGFNLPFDGAAFAREAKRLLRELEAEVGWMYETRHTDGRTGRINYTVWSEVFACPDCAGEVVFVEEALNARTGRVRDDFPCPQCGATLNKDRLERVFETEIDSATGEPWRHVKFQPALIDYGVPGERGAFRKKPDVDDLARIEQVARLPLPPAVPTIRFPVEQMYHGSRIEPKGFTHVHHFFLPRAAQALGALWAKAEAVADTRLRNQLLWFLEQAVWSMSILNRHRPTGYSQVGQFLTGVYYVPSQHSEVSLWEVLNGKLKRLSKAFAEG